MKDTSPVIWCSALCDREGRLKQDRILACYLFIGIFSPSFALISLMTLRQAEGFLLLQSVVSLAHMCLTGRGELGLAGVVKYCKAQRERDIDFWWWLVGASGVLKFCTPPFLTLWILLLVFHRLTGKLSKKALGNKAEIIHVWTWYSDKMVPCVFPSLCLGDACVQDVSVPQEKGIVGMEPVHLRKFQRLKHLKEGSLPSIHLCLFVLISF